MKGTTVLQGIKNKLGDRVKVIYAKGCEVTNEHWPETEVLPEPLTQKEKEEIAKAVEVAKNSDVAVVVLGDSPNTVGETASRTSLDLPGRQLDLVQAVYAAGKPVVVSGCLQRHGHRALCRKRLVQGRLHQLEVVHEHHRPLSVAIGLQPWRESERTSGLSEGLA